MVKGVASTISKLFFMKGLHSCPKTIIELEKGKGCIPNNETLK
jgi:hypothetical protein